MSDLKALSFTSLGFKGAVEAVGAVGAVEAVGVLFTGVVGLLVGWVSLFGTWG